MRSPKEVLIAWVAAFNARDARAAADLYDEEATNIQVAVGTPLVGREAIYQDLLSFFTAFPDTYTKIENLFECGEWGIVEWSGGGTFRNPLPGLPPTGRSFTLQGCGFFHIPRGKIMFQRGYWDRATWFGQVGIPVEIPDSAA